MEAKIWNKGMDKTMILITGPTREKDYFSNGDEVWHCFGNQENYCSTGHGAS